MVTRTGRSRPWVQTNPPVVRRRLHVANIAVALLVAAAPIAAERAPARLLVQRDVGAADEPGDRFGSAVAVGDFDADGYQDLAVSAPYENYRATDNGFVAVYYGGVGGAGAGGTWWFNQSHLAGAADESHDRFGWSLAVGDFDGDRYDDLAVGIPYEDAASDRDVGAVAVVYGSVSGLHTSGAEVITQSSFGGAVSEPGDRFGWSLAVGDFDGDRYDDLAIGAPYEDTRGMNDTGAVTVLFGSYRGLQPIRHEVITQSQLITVANEAHDRFGYALTSGDFEGDGYDDLAVGVPYEHVGDISDAGVVVVLKGSSAGLLPARDRYYDQKRLLAGVNRASDHFGFALATGNFDGDAWDDLLVGVPGKDLLATNAGMVAVAYGSSRGLVDRDAAVTLQTSREDPAAHERFATSFAVADFDGDGFDDLVAGVPYENGGGARDSGGLVAIFGARERDLFERRYGLHQAELGPLDEAGDRLGSALAAGDFDGDGLAELAMGVAFEDLGSRRDSGAVLVTALEPALPRLGSGQAAIVVDRCRGFTVGSYYADERRPIGSTTKMMTGLLVVEAIESGRLDLDDTVTVSATAVDAARNGGSAVGGANVGLAVGDQIEVEDLLHGLLLDSGNDAAVAFAEQLEGSAAGFVERMNQRADELGLDDTSFANAHGRDPQKMTPDDCPELDFETPACAHFSTARDLARLAGVALAEPLFARVVETARWPTSSWTDDAGVSRDRTLTTTNNLVDPADAEFYAGAYGVKTGTTGRAGACLVSAAGKMPFRNVIAVLLGADDDADRYGDSTILLDWGLSEVPLCEPPATD